MRVVAVYKWARGVDGATVHGDGSVQWRVTKMVAGEDDHAVLTVAQAVAGGSDGSVVGLTIGDGDASWALARGVTETVSVADAPFLTDEAATAQVLAAAVRSLGDVDVVAIGDAEEHPGVGVALAGLLGWGVVPGVTRAEVADGRVAAVRRVGDVEETVSAATPVVLAVAAEAAEPKAPGMKELLAARKRPVITTTLADLGAAPVDPLDQRGTRVPEVTAARLFDGEPADAARALVAALRNEGVLR